MSSAIFKGETSIKDLAKRIFGLSDKSSPAQVDQAAGALLQANPQLQQISKVPVGSVISVPATAPPLNPAEAAPAGLSSRTAIAGQAQDTLDSLNQRLTEIEGRLASSANALLALAQARQTQTTPPGAQEIKAQLPALVASLQSIVTATQVNQSSRGQVLSDLHASVQSFAQNKS